jgi:hypothetical protein
VTAQPAGTQPPRSTQSPANTPPPAKPAVRDLGLDLAAQAWQRSGTGDGAIEVAFVRPDAESGPAAQGASAGQWVLMRVTGDPEGRVLVFDRNEWECFLDGARNGEFDDATDQARQTDGSEAAQAAGRAVPSVPTPK